MEPVTSAAITAYYSEADSSGNTFGWCLITVANANDIDKSDVFYRVLYHEIGTPDDVWWYLMDFPWEKWFFGVKIRFARLPNQVNQDAPAPPSIIVDKVRILTVNIDDEEDFAVKEIATAVSLEPIHEKAHDFSFVCYGDIGDLGAAVNLRWKDMSKFISGGRITLTKHGVTSPGKEQFLYDRTFTSFPFTFSEDYSSPNFIQIGFPLIPPGIEIPDPPVFSAASQPYQDPNSPMWVAEGDVLTLTITTLVPGYVDPDPNAQPGTGKRTSFNFQYFRIARFYQFADAATVHQPYRKYLEIIQDPWRPSPPITGQFSLHQIIPASPPAGAWTLSSQGLLQCLDPLNVGHYVLDIHLTSRGNAASEEPVLLAINVQGLPVIKAPPPSLPLVAGLPWPEAFNFYATNHPTLWIRTGDALPTGLTLDTATGEITGTPTVAGESKHIFFQATNAIGASPLYETQWTVTAFTPPVITSLGTHTVYKEELTPYQITTDQPAISYRAFDLPGGVFGGLKLLGSVLTGIPKAPPGVYNSKLQAANRWGWSVLFPLQITVRVAPPVVFSPGEINIELNTPLDPPFQIIASHSPTSYGATFLPIGLIVNEHTGVIAGTPTVEGTYDEIELSATNEGGTGTASLIINVVLPPRPVIDVSATNGRAITWETGRPFEFTPSASHDPYEWTAGPIPDDLTLTVGNGKLTGIFRNGGFYGVTFTARNAPGPGGISDPATFHFLVSLSSIQAEVINQLGTVQEIWIDLDTAVVGIGNHSTIEEEHPVPPSGTALVVKRGDTTEIVVIFHSGEDSIPADVVMTSLKFGIKEGYDDEFIVFTEVFRRIEAGRFRTFPDFSGTNDDLDAILVEESTTLIGEIQWEMLDPLGNSIRRSSVVFDVTILRDLIHPD